VVRKFVCMLVGISMTRCTVREDFRPRPLVKLGSRITQPLWREEVAKGAECPKHLVLYIWRKYNISDLDISESPMVSIEIGLEYKIGAGPRVFLQILPASWEIHQHLKYVVISWFHNNSWCWTHRLLKYSTNQCDLKAPFKLPFNLWLWIKGSMNKIKLLQNY
jgi:hypothetical protein